MLMLRHHPQHGAPTLGDPHHLSGPPVDLSGHYAAFAAGQPPFTHSCILEMRKEKSRDAARSRRGKENYEFYELAKLLPLPAAITTQLDKASIIRLSISYLKLRDFIQHGDPPWNRETPAHSKVKGGSLRSRSTSSIAMDIFEQHQGTHILQSLDGFAFALSADGRFLYISETVSIYLGLSQVEMTGSSVFDYIHQQDHAELAEQLGINLAQSQSQNMASSPGSVASDDGSSSSAPGVSTPNLDRPLPVMTMNSNTLYKGMDRSFCVRMKSTLTKRGCHFKSSGYRVVLVLSHMRPHYSFGGHAGRGKQGAVNVMGMVAMAIALPPPSINEVRLESDMFVTRLTFEFRVAHCEPRVSDLLDYTAEELTGKNMYTLCHGQDVQKLRKCHIDLINKGQVMSGYYRLMNKSGGYTWMQTCATVICNSKNSDEQSIICVNYVLSGIEYEHCILDCSQMPNSGNLKPDDPGNSERESSPDADTRDENSSRDGTPKPAPTTSGDGKMSIQVESSTVNLNGFEMEPKQLDLSVDMARYPESKHSNHHVCIDGQTHSRVKKRRLLSNGQQHHHIILGDPTTDRKSPPDSNNNVLSSLANATSPLDNGVDRVTPDRTGSHRSSTPPSAGDLGNDKIDRPWKRSPSNSASTRTAYNSSSGSAMSVKELEDVMNKHLPSSSTQDSQDLGKGQQQRSTIQWIGAPQTTLPASSLLRQIYVNRESVIRSGTHISRPTYYESQGPLPTPPGSGSNEPYPDQNQFMLPSKMAAESYGVIAAGYSTAPVTVTSYMDTYSAMTPPASVSPRDKFHPGISDTAAFSEAAAAAAAAAIPHMHHYVSDGALQHLPLKPQVFVHPGSLDPATYGHSHSQQSLSPEQQQQLYAHHASGFHLYHPSSSSKTSHHTANGTSWYSQPNT
ncbi:Protein trachealess like protein [Argiope bruennichi]|uniref:Protein trachealess like protein n=1 Tax=Argiope bruennichi TaxID=94029 RepID=A0A8T0FPR7_ARGBR|nr:Protein trachealess like protein [Argiope bruennichi]